MQLTTRKRNTLRAGVAIAIAALAVSLAIPQPVDAWDVTHPYPGVVRVARSVNDTTVATIRLYSSSTEPTMSVSDPLLWDNGPWVTVGDATLQANQRSAEFRFPAGAKQLDVRVTDAAQTFYFFVQPQDVATVRVEGVPQVGVVSMPPVSLDSSVSIDGTLPVTVGQIGTFDADAPIVAVVLVSMLAFILTGIHGAVMLSKGGKR